MSLGQRACEQSEDGLHLHLHLVLCCTCALLSPQGLADTKSMQWQCGGRQLAPCWKDLQG